MSVDADLEELRAQTESNGGRLDALTKAKSDHELDLMTPEELLADGLDLLRIGVEKLGNIIERMRATATEGAS